MVDRQLSIDSVQWWRRWTIINRSSVWPIIIQQQFESASDQWNVHNLPRIIPILPHRPTSSHIIPHIYLYIYICPPSATPARDCCRECRTEERDSPWPIRAPTALFLEAPPRQVSIRSPMPARPTIVWGRAPMASASMFISTQARVTRGKLLCWSLSPFLPEFLLRGHRHSSKLHLPPLRWHP